MSCRTSMGVMAGKKKVEELEGAEIEHEEARGCHA